MSNRTSECLRRNTPAILAEWEARARKSILSSKGLTSLVLKDSLNSFLSQVTDALSTTIARTSMGDVQDDANILYFAKKHGGERANESLHYSLAEVILEFQILQLVILEVLEREFPVPLDDRTVIISKVGQALGAAATQFADANKNMQEQFVQTLVHDIRTPVFVAKMSAAVLLRDPGLAPTSVRWVNKIVSNMDRLEAMLKDLLDVSRIRAGMGLAFDFETVRLDALAKDVIQDMTEMHGDRFELHADGPIEGQWNRAGLRRVLENLIINAVKYGLENTPVRVTVTQTPTSATLVVHNDGNPIPVEDQSKLFAKFVRADPALSTTGWGLGLALVSGMVTAHQGTVRIESSAEQGTDFIVELPKIMVDQP